MRRILLIALLSIPLVSLWAQRDALPTPEDLNRFRASKTYVVLADNPIADYNFEIKDAVNKAWNITDFEFIENKDFEEKSKDPQASFLYVARVNFEKDKTNSHYMFLCLSMGGSDHYSLNDLKDITNIPLGYSGVDEEEYTYKLGTLLRFMQDHVRRLLDDPALVSQNVFQMYNDNMGDLSTKTLYLVLDEVDPRVASEAGIRSVYPYPFKIVEREDIKELIMAGDENAVFLHKVGPGDGQPNARIYKAIVGVADARFYYYNHHKASDKNPDAILMNDFKRIGRAPN